MPVYPNQLLCHLWLVILLTLKVQTALMKGSCINFLIKRLTESMSTTRSLNNYICRVFFTHNKENCQLHIFKFIAIFYNSKVPHEFPTFYNFWNPSIYNILRWVAWTMEQTNRRPKVWCSKYFSFYTFYRLRALKTLIFIFSIL